jgi:hypothetical protein
MPAMSPKPLPPRCQTVLHGSITNRFSINDFVDDRLAWIHIDLWQWAESSR